jgi:putative membrane protein insertion efficiency factor
MNIAQLMILQLIRVYRLLLSPWLGNNCRFHPSCSHYAEQAIREHGALMGSWLTFKRLGKCHPWHEGGLDPVPPSTTNRH